MGDAVFDRFGGRKKGTLWYHRSLVDAFEQRRAGIGPKAEGPLDELAAIVEALEDVAGEGGS